MGAIEDVALDLLGGVGGGSPSPRLVELRALDWQACFYFQPGYVLVVHARDGDK